MTPRKASLASDAERRSLGPDVPLPRSPAAEDRVGAGLYVHVPFCLTRCGYCDFNTYAGLDHMASPYVDALLREADLSVSAWAGVRFVSIFLGGGTPTILPVPEMVGLLGHLRGVFDVAPGAEVTSEANPDTVDRAYLDAIRGAGVTRLSMGAQSFDPSVLRALERTHGPDAVRRASVAARDAGFDDLNLDLIYGAHGESLDSWRHTIDETLAIGPEHVSAYALTIEPATPLGRSVASGRITAPDGDLQAEMYAAACEAFAAAGYEHYEVSNWAKPGHRCLHNLGYWRGGPYLGLGAGAHSYRDGRRWWNVRPPQRYVDLIEAGEPPVGGDETLTASERDLERLLLGLRVADGVPTSWVDADEAARFVAEGLARRTGDRLSLTDRGLLLANELVLSLAG
jgi:putative oxygen-independent coproporphyrinogen III oxidase